MFPYLNIRYCFSHSHLSKEKLAPETAVNACYMCKGHTQWPHIDRQWDVLVSWSNHYRSSGKTLTDQVYVPSKNVLSGTVLRTFKNWKIMHKCCSAKFFSIIFLFTNGQNCKVCHSCQTWHGNLATEMAKRCSRYITMNYGACRNGRKFAMIECQVV